MMSEFRETPYRVLVVERDPVLRIMLAGTLQLRGHFVVTAADTPTPLDLLGRLPFDLVIVDVYAGRPVTCAAVRTLRRAMPNLTIIATCAGFHEPGPEIAQRIGVAMGLDKPFLPDRLCDAVEQLLDRHEETWTLIGAETAALDHRVTRH